MTRNKIKPMLFSIIKHTSPEDLKKQLPKDIISGVIVAIVALPLSIALAIASGVGPEMGLYTAIVAGFIISFLGGSRVQISGPTAAFATMVPVFLVGNKKVSWTALIFAFLMGVSRIYLVVHYPSDVLGGIIVGVVAGCLGALIAAKLPEAWYASWRKKKKAGEEECSDSEN